MDLSYNKIFLIGFRVTGKSTIGKLLAKKLSWDFMEMDEIITKKTGKTINDLTEGGTKWELFRYEEHQLLHTLAQKENIVVSTGGGVFVNNIKTKNNKTFGVLNAQLLSQIPNSLVVGLTASENIIKNRIKIAENRSLSSRPILNPTLAKAVISKLKKVTSLSEQKEIMISNIEENAIQVFRKRSPKYQRLARVIIDTGIFGKDEVVKKILRALHKGGKHVH